MVLFSEFQQLSATGSGPPIRAWILTDAADKAALGTDERRGKNIEVLTQVAREMSFWRVMGKAEIQQQAAAQREEEKRQSASARTQQTDERKQVGEVQRKKADATAQEANRTGMKGADFWQQEAEKKVEFWRQETEKKAEFWQQEAEMKARFWQQEAEKKVEFWQQEAEKRGTAMTGVRKADQKKELAVHDVVEEVDERLRAGVIREEENEELTRVQEAERRAEVAEAKLQEAEKRAETAERLVCIIKERTRKEPPLYFPFFH